MRPTRKQLFPLAILLLILAAPAQAAFKCWTNSEGVRECGNVVPPEYAQKETRTYSEQGVMTGIKNRALTPEEVAAKRAAAAEDAKQSAARQHAEREQASYDRVLLSTYLSTQEIMDSLQRKLAVIDGYIELSRITISKLEEKRQQEQLRAANLERQGQTIPPTLIEEMQRIDTEIADKNTFIASKEEEKKVLRQQHNADYQRFRELNRRQSH